MPVERLPFLRERLEGHDVLRSTLLLDSVPVDERRQVVEAVLRRGHRGLPRLPDVLLAVAEDAVHPPGLVIHAGREREADGERQTLALGARRVLDAGRGPQFRMALEAAVQLAERQELVDGAESARRKGCVPDRAGVGFAQDESIPIPPRRILRIAAEGVGVQRGYDVPRGPRAPRTAGLTGR